MLGNYYIYVQMYYEACRAKVKVIIQEKHIFLSFLMI